MGPRRPTMTDADRVDLSNPAYGSSTLLNSTTTGCTAGSGLSSTEVNFPFLMHIDASATHLYAAVPGCKPATRR